MKDKFKIRPKAPVLYVLLLCALSFGLDAQSIHEEELLLKNEIARSTLSSNATEGLRLAKNNFLNLRDKSVSQHVEAKIRSTLALAYHVNDNFVKAIEHRLQAIELFKNIGNTDEVIESYNLLGGIFYNVGDYENTIKHTMTALDLAENHNSGTTHIPTLYNNLAGAYKELGAYKSALHYANKLFDYTPIDEEFKVYAISTLGEIYLAKGECDTALSYLNQIKKYTDPAVSKSAQLSTFISLDLSKIFYCLGDTAQSLNYAQSAFYQSKQHAFARSALNAAKLLNTIWTALDDADSSLFYGKQLLTLQDSLWSKEKENQLNRVIIKYQQNEIDNQRKETEKQKLINAYGIIIALLLLFSLIILVFANRKFKKLNTELEHQKNELKRLHSFKDKLFSIVVHDFKTPINSIEGMLDLIIKGHLSAGEAEELASRMQQHVWQSKASIEQLIIWLKSQMGGIGVTLSEVSLDELFSKVKSYHINLAESKGITINYKVETNVLFSSDYELLFIIINNLISNAIKFTPANGEIKLSGLLESNGNILIKVTDNGVGLSEDQLGNIFDITKDSSTGTSAETGTGLGLVICKELMEKLNGNITIESQKHVGTTVFLSIPQQVIIF